MKGWEALKPLYAGDRAKRTYVRNEKGKLTPTDWDTALRLFTTRFKTIQDQFGNDAIAWLGTGQICTEELAFLGALAKFGMSWFLLVRTFVSRIRSCGSAYAGTRIGPT